MHGITEHAFTMYLVSHRKFNLQLVIEPHRALQRFRYPMNIGSRFNATLLGLKRLVMSMQFQYFTIGVLYINASQE